VAREIDFHCMLDLLELTGVLVPHISLARLALAIETNVSRSRRLRLIILDSIVFYETVRKASVSTISTTNVGYSLHPQIVYAVAQSTSGNYGNHSSSLSISDRREFASFVLNTYSYIVLSMQP
jgi:hypothetical protein